MDQTLVVIKPDCVVRRMVGVVISAIESSGLTISRIEQRTLSEKQAKNLYEEHEGKWHFARNIRHITSGPVVLLRVHGPDAVQRCRTFVEHFREAHSDVIKLPRNLVHATTGQEKVDAELKAVDLQN